MLLFIIILFIYTHFDFQSPTDFAYLKNRPPNGLLLEYKNFECDVGAFPKISFYFFLSVRDRSVSRLLQRRGPGDEPGWGLLNPLVPRAQI